MILVVFVALLILFLWLHLILAQQIESVGREIQVAQEELDKIKRQNYTIQGEIANTYTQENMATRALDLNYRPQQPLYLSIDQPLPPSTHDLDPAALSILLPGSSTQTAGQVPADLPGTVQAVANPP
jgi:hypothetical protein